MATRYGKKAQAKISKVMREFKEGKLHSGSKKGPKVKSRKQAIAIGISEAKRAGARVPPKSTRSKKRTTRTRTAKRRS